MTDASFKEGANNPLKILARDEGDLEVVSTLCQDAIAERKEMLFEAEKKCFSLLLRRFRWEDAEDAQKRKRPFERVQSVLMIRSALGVKVQGINLKASELIFDLISIRFVDDQIFLSFAGEGEIAVKVECIDVVLTDVSRPYTARSTHYPQHNQAE